MFLLTKNHINNESGFLSYLMNYGFISRKKYSHIFYHNEKQKIIKIQMFLENCLQVHTYIILNV